MPLIFLGSIDAATDATMATVTNQVNSRFRAALVDLIEALVVGSPDPVLKWVYRENGVWTRDVPGGELATHYVLPDHNGVPTVRATPFPVPSSSAMELEW